MAGIDVTPSASRLVGSLRDIGYDLNTAVADLVDNSIAAMASTVDINIKFDGLDSTVTVSDDGVGMSSSGLDEALRFGTRRDYATNELGRYGLGLKTASISQGRRLTVLTRSAPRQRRIHARRLDLDWIDETDRWEITDVDRREALRLAVGQLDDGPGTVVVIDRLDRMLPGRKPEGGWARRRFTKFSTELATHLGMVFHRFIEGDLADRVMLVVNGEKVEPWNPFAPDEEATLVLPVRLLPLHGGKKSPVRLRPYVLPSRSQFSTPEAHQRMSGPGRWNRQQGFYIYRAGRLIQSGGWGGLRAQDEHTKLARAALEFDTDADDAFRINVAKMRVSVPTELRAVLSRPVQELCNRANAAYRIDAAGVRRTDTLRPAAPGSSVGLSLMAAAAECGETAALSRILDTLRATSPDVAEGLGWS